MSGYGGPDDDQVNAQAKVDNGIDLARMMIKKGPGSPICWDCGESIPEARRQAVPGCTFCIDCQSSHDKMPALKLLTRIL
jgi:phage/conjugal plasmid C-4 type zinc finger TraR family protein